MLLISAPTSSGISISLDFIWVTCNPSHLNRYSDALKAPSEWPVMWYCGKDNGVGFSSRCELAQSLPALSMDQVLTSLGCILLICEIKVWTDMSEASTTSKILVSWMDLISVGQSLLLHLSKWRELRDFNTSPKVYSTECQNFTSDFLTTSLADSFPYASPEGVYSNIRDSHKGVNYLEIVFVRVLWS
jgi:hypothetical protein